MVFGFGRFAAALLLLLIAISSRSHAAPPPPDTFNPDPNATVTFVFDVDGTLMHNLGNYIVKLAPKPGVPGLISVGGMPQEALIPVHDYEGTTGLRIRERLGRFENGIFIQGSLEPITLSNGKKFIPGHYYFSDPDGYREFRPPPSGKAEDGYAFNQVVQKFLDGSPFLLEATPFLAAGFSKEYGGRINLMLDSMRGHAGDEWVLLLNKIADYFSWGQKSLHPDSMVNQTHDRWLNYSQSKGKFHQALYTQISRINIDMTTHNVPHFLVMFENDYDKHLDEIALKFRELSGAGIFQNPVIPILVDLLEPEAFNNRNGTDWKRSVLETFQKRSRVQIYWGPGNIERSNDLSLVFQRTLGLSPEAAKALYTKYENPFMCRNFMIGKENISCVLGECMTKGLK